MFFLIIIDYKCDIFNMRETFFCFFIIWKVDDRIQS